MPQLMSQSFMWSLFVMLLFSVSGQAYADKSEPASGLSASSDTVNSDKSANERTPLNYKGWAVLKRNKLDPSAAEEDWVSMGDIRIQDAGERLRFMDGDTETPYWIELIEITYEESNTTVLKLALYEEGNDRAFTYIWGEPGAARLGLNLRWIQVGLTKAE